MTKGFIGTVLAAAIGTIIAGVVMNMFMNRPGAK